MPQIALSSIQPGVNPRSYFDPDEMAELVDSIRAQGVLQPILVRPVTGTDQYQVVAGERRVRAAREAGLEQIEVIVKALSDEEVAAAALTENVIRADMSGAEEAEAAQVCLMRNHGDKEETARALGWSADKLAKRLALMICAPEVRDALTQRKISLGHAELLAAVPTAMQVRALARIIEGGLSVEYLKAHIGKLSHRLADAIFDTTQCNACPHNSDTQASLFSNHVGAGYCTNPAHYDELTHARIEEIAAAQRENFPKVVVYRAEDGFKRLALSAEGALGVGSEQAKACRSCANFGCAISAIAGSQGQVTENLCFDAACNQKMVAARIRAEKPPAAAAPTNKGASTHKKAVASTVPKQDAKPNVVPKAVHEYRVAQWRKMLARALRDEPEKAQALLLGLALAESLNDVDVGRYRATLEKRIPGTPGALLNETVAYADTLSTEHKGEALALLPCAAAYGVGEHDLRHLLSWLKVEVGAHWRLEAALLECMTKVEIEAVVEEMGLKAALKDKFAKLVNGKKEEFIDALLKVDGFDYAGVVPQLMQFAREKAESQTT
jgi:ParB family transcriptional regulator, chromosome partitioning protein